ncbi:MAG: isocitrate dehydrogenase (NADP(+)) [Deltaproteobacteria bacterium]|nr:isocitrate dehydrogenase (NADP(+)) [Deltaproteobacteria bacterium]MBW2075510.1 isocitrate dehydrogenase (NADP(+)) [Deltaproteobacteria bacterium]
MVSHEPQRITAGAQGTLQVPDTPVIPFIEGDGIGPDIWAATQGVLDAAIRSAYGDQRRITWLEVLAGEKAYRETGEWLPEGTLQAIKDHVAAIKGPLTTPVGKGIRSVNVALRQRLDLYACVRPIQYISGVPSPMRHPERVNMVVFRENTEDVYAGIEWEAQSREAEAVIDFLKDRLGVEVARDSAIGIKPMSRPATRRLVARAVQYALDHNFPSVTLVHKGNIMKYTEGAFMKWGYEVACEMFGDFVLIESERGLEREDKVPQGKVVIKDRIADMMFQQVLLRPEAYHVIATPNLNGDYLSDALAAQVGGLGMAPGANIGDNCAVFEATHGSAPKYAGQDKANPISLILSGVMMLEYLGWSEAALAIKQAVQKSISEGLVTHDLARQMPGTRELRCSEFAQAVIERLT